MKIGDLYPRSGLGPMDNPGYAAPSDGLSPELEALRPKKRGTINDILGSIFDAMSALGGGKANYWNDVNADQQDFRDTQAKYAEELRQRQGRLSEIAAKAQIEAGLPSYDYFDDNAGNRWRMDKRTGQVDSAPAFVDRNPKMFIQDGQLITVPNSYAGGSAPSGISGPVGKLTPIPEGGPTPRASGGFR